MARDVKEAVANMATQTLAQERMLNEQGKLLHDQRGVMQTMKSLAEAIALHQAIEFRNDHHANKPDPKITEEPQ
jgi:hypothetical protein